MCERPLEERSEWNFRREGYRLEEAGNGVRVLKRSGSYVLATFGRGVASEKIQHVAEADERYRQARELRTKFGLRGDAESALMFTGDVKEAREKYLLALEAAYRK
jgi:hypothetical protein